jgi:asparagine N-glycosylation enzyme membrane subunit Stt3
MRPAFKLSLVCLIFLLALFIRSEYIREEGKYILGADPYYHYRMAETIITEGSRPEWDYIACYPTGKPVSYPPLFQYYLAYSFKVIGNPLGMDLFHWCIYGSIIPLFFCIVLIFVIGSLLISDYGGLLAALLFGTIPAVTMRTVIGFTDTDTFVLLFSLLIVLFFVLTIRLYTQYHTFSIVSAFLCGSSLFLFSKTWPGYWYMLPLVCAGYAVWILQKRELNRLEAFIFFLVGFIGFFALFEGAYIELVAVFMGVLLFEVSKRMDKDALSVGIGVIVLGVSAWAVFSLDVISPVFSFLPFAVDPASDVLAHNVTQMIVDNFRMTPEITWQLLGPSLVLAPLGVFFLIKERKWWIFTFLTLYISGTSFMLLRGGRFSLLLAIPLCLGAAWGVDYVYCFLQSRYANYAKLTVSVIIVIVLSIHLVQSNKFNNGARFMDDDLWEALTWIDSTTDPDSVVISHWGLGFLVESVARRHSVMNGSQYDLFWRMVKFGTILTTENEEIAVKEVYGFNNISEVENIRTFSSDSEMAQKQIADEMTPFAEGNAYLLIDEYTALTLSWWSLYGTWNYAVQDGESVYYNVAFLSSARKQGKIIEYTYASGHDMIFVYKADEMFHGFVPQKGQITPVSGTIFFKNGNKYFLVRDEGAYGILFLPYCEEEYLGKDIVFHNMSTYILGIPVQLRDSLITYLYFLDGDGLTYFELVKDCGKVKVYKVLKTPQKGLNKGCIQEEDEFSLVVVPT